jgi:thiamine-phosphate pyrophosphorylase
MSCYDDINLAKQAQDQGANYVAFGALFPSNTKPNAINCSLDTIAQAKQVLNIPIVGIGGVNFKNQQQAFDAGCDAVAMINALFQSAD